MGNYQQNSWGLGCSRRKGDCSSFRSIRSTDLEKERLLQVTMMMLIIIILVWVFIMIMIVIII